MLPVLSKRKEFGVFGSTTGCPVTKGEVEEPLPTGTNVGVHVALVVAQPVVVT